MDSDYGIACRRAREEAVHNDQTLDEARIALAQQVKVARRSFARYESLPAITELTDEQGTTQQLLAQSGAPPTTDKR